jgi:Ni/Co efflux regulator RcnB
MLMKAGGVLVRILFIGAAVSLALLTQQAMAAESAAIGPAAADHAQSKYLLLAGGKAKGNVLGISPGNKGVFGSPGQAKKWARGQYLPKSAVWTPVPAVLLAKLKPAPPGHQYVVVDGQVLLIALATGLILDALDVI